MPYVLPIQGEVILVFDHKEWTFCLTQIENSEIKTNSWWRRSWHTWVWQSEGRNQRWIWKENWKPQSRTLGTNQFVIRGKCLETRRS